MLGANALVHAAESEIYDRKKMIKAYNGQSRNLISHFLNGVSNETNSLGRRARHACSRVCVCVRISHARIRLHHTDRQTRTHITYSRKHLADRRCVYAGWISSVYVHVCCASMSCVLYAAFQRICMQSRALIHEQRWPYTAAPNFQKINWRIL